MSTSQDTLKSLCKSILTRMENQKAIVFSPRLRQIIQDEIYEMVKPAVFTEADLRDKTLARIGAKAEELESVDLTETERYRTAKNFIRESFGDDVLNGFYFQKPVKHLAGMIAQYFMRSSHIDDVFETDEDLEKQIVDAVKKFDPKNLH